MRFSDLADRRVVVWGHGREGRSVVTHLGDLGVDVRVAEPDLDGGEDPQVAYGEAGRARLLSADVVVKSPGVPVTHELHRELLARAVPVTSLTDLWVTENAERVVAVTGTKGKSTTATLVHHLLTHAGIRSSLRGNIGTSVLEETDPPAEVVVMELSSYQAQSLTRSPRVVAVTSLFPEHLTWHGGLEEYFHDKLNSVAHDPEYVVVPGDDDVVLRRVRAQLSPGAALVTTDESSVHVDAAGDVVWGDGTEYRVAAAELPLTGRHHAGNIALAARIAGLLGVSPLQVTEALATFTALPYRMERVPSNDGRTWIDDSLATAPEAVVASLASLADRRVAVIIGGDDRGLDFDVLLEALESRADVEVLLVGPVGARIAPDCDGRLFNSFHDAVVWAHSEENPADTVLLSPGAPSYDEFANYEARSEAFRAAALVPADLP